MNQILKVSTYMSLVFVCFGALATKGELAHLNEIFATNWSYTYLKAEKGKATLMQQHIEKNWFAMDAKAVDVGLFRDYKIIENLSTEDNKEWDIIVAVEYFGKESYSDIASEFEAIRKQHTSVAVTGFNPKKDFKIVRSERIATHKPFARELACPIDKYNLLKPFLGYWKEISVTDEGEEILGTLEFNIVPERCTLSKRFELTGNDQGYASQITLERKTGIWREVFNYFGRFDWEANGDKVYMKNLGLQLPEGHQRRNHWLPVSENVFHINVEQSEDHGKTWEVLSHYRVERL